MSILASLYRLIAIYLKSLFSSYSVRLSRVTSRGSIERGVRIRKSALSGSVALGKNSLVKNSTLSGNIVVGEHAKLISVWINGAVKIGRFTSVMGPSTDIRSKINPINIGSFCSIARNVSFQEYAHPINRLSTYYMGKNVFSNSSVNGDIESKGPITIGNDVWIGAHSVILSGVCIGNGAVIGANSVVTKNVPPYAIMAGSPAKIIRYRFERKTIELLSEVRWWDWPIEEIIERKRFFEIDDEKQLLAILQSLVR